MDDESSHIDAPPESGAWSESSSEAPDSFWGVVSRLPGAVYRCTYDTEWQSLYMGNGFEEICGLPPETLDPSGRSFKEVVLDEDRDKIRTQVRAAVEDQSHYSIEYRIRANDGTVRWVEDNGRPVFDDEENVKWLDGILLDVTDRKEAERSLRRMKETLAQQVEERTQQLRHASALLTVAEQRERDELARRLHDDVEQFLYGVQAQAKMLVDGIEEHPEVDADTLPVDPSYVESLLRDAIETTRRLAVDLSPPVLDSDGLTEALQWLRSQMQQNGDFEVVLEETPSAPSIPDELRMLLFQAVRELILNVREHAGVDQARVRARIDEGEEGLVLSVTDDGEGFSHNGELPDTDSGFGLRRVRERVRFFGGTLDIDTAPGEGTRCTIRMPMTDQHNVPVNASSSSSGTSTASPFLFWLTLSEFLCRHARPNSAR